MHLYGTNDYVEQVNLKNQLKADRLPVDKLHQREKERKQKEKEQEKRRIAELKQLKAAQKGLGSAKGRGGQQWEAGSSQTDYVSSQIQGDQTPAQSLEDIMRGSEHFNPREMGEIVEKFGVGEDVLVIHPVGARIHHATLIDIFDRQKCPWLSLRSGLQPSFFLINAK